MDSMYYACKGESNLYLSYLDMCTAMQATVKGKKGQIYIF